MHKLSVDVVHILWLEDTVDTPATLRVELAALAYVLHHVSSSLEALSLLSKHEFALAFIGQASFLGEADRKLLEAIDRDEKNQDLAIIVSCAGEQESLASLDQLQSIRDKGLIDCIVRPYPVSLLLAKIKYCCRLFIQKQELRQQRLASRAKTEFLARMSHELRTPLNLVVGSIDVLTETREDAAKQAYLDLLRQAADNLCEIINEVLEISKIESGELRLEQLPFAIDEHLASLVQFYTVKAQRQGLSLNFFCKLPASDREVYGDPFRLKQICHNLLANALKFTASGFVNLRCESSAGRHPNERFFTFVVEDSGMGIAKERWQAIFEPFTQADTTTSRYFGGSGLGLAICKKFVALMGGQIWLESEPGKGSKFYFKVPFALLGCEQAKLQQKVPASSLPEKLRPLKILLADDCKDSRFLMQAFLQQSPHSLTVVSDGKEAFELFCAKDFDLVVMDMQMPVMDGMTATSEIRRWEKEAGRRPVPILALTGHAFKEEAKNILESGCNEHLAKPIRKKALIAMISKFAS